MGKQADFLKLHKDLKSDWKMREVNEDRPTSWAVILMIAQLLLIY